MFPVIVIIGQILVAYAFCVIMLALFRKVEPITQIVTKTHYHQLGKRMREAAQQRSRREHGKAGNSRGVLLLAGPGVVH